MADPSGIYAGLNVVAVDGPIRIVEFQPGKLLPRILGDESRPNSEAAPSQSDGIPGTRTAGSVPID